MKISNQMGLRGKLTKLDKKILCNVDPPLAPPPTLTNKHVL